MPEEKKLELDTSKLIPLNIASGFSEDPDYSQRHGLSSMNASCLMRPKKRRLNTSCARKGKFANRIIIPFMTGRHRVLLSGSRHR